MAGREIRWGYCVSGTLVAVAALLFVLALSAPAANAGDKDCADFDSQKKAQKFFKKHDPRNDPHGLDADHDGVACETNPCPCQKSSVFRAEFRIAGARVQVEGFQDVDLLRR